MPYQITKSAEIKVINRESILESNIVFVPIDKESFAAEGINARDGFLARHDIRPTMLSLADYEKFCAEEGQNLTIQITENKSIKYVILLGIGGSSGCKFGGISTVAETVSNISQGKKAASIAILTNYITSENEKQTAEIISELCYCIAHKSYSFSRYLTTEKALKKISTLKTINIVTEKESEYKEVAIQQAQKLEAVNLTRDLVNEPANIIYPESYAEIINEQLKNIDGVKITILDKKDLTKIGMHMLLAVGMGSEKEPCVVIIEYRGNKNSKDTDAAFIGKGVTFDSGGLSIKPAEGMEEMKCDMAGSAAVVGALKLIASRKAKVNIVGIVGLVENSINGIAQRPGDVVKSLSGQTVEVLNTDAEGRLVLGDILYYAAREYSPKHLIDLATLTGAVMVALGTHYAGLFSNSCELTEKLKAAGHQTNEPLWPLPMGDKYDKTIDSDIADMKNISGGRYAGSTIGAQFLKRFIGNCQSWAHLDIAGTAFAGKGGSGGVKGATGYGVRLLDAFCKDNLEQA